MQLLCGPLSRCSVGYRPHRTSLTVWLYHADEPSVKRGSFFFGRASAEAVTSPDAAPDDAAADSSTIAAGEPLSPRPSKSEERLQRVRRMQMAQFMDQLRRTSLQQASLSTRSCTVL